MGFNLGFKGLIVQHVLRVNVTHHQEPQLYLRLLVYIRLWRPPVVPSEWEPVPTQTAPRAVSTSVCKPEAASTVEIPDDERHNARNMLNY